MRAPVLFAIVFTIHVVTLGGFVMMQGCSTPAPGQPPQPVMPPKPIDTGAVKSVKQLKIKTVKPARVKPGATTSAAVHTIQKGESLSKIAVAYGVSSRELAEYNNIKNSNLIRSGQKILIPPHGKKTASVASKKPATPSRKPAKVAAGGGSYTVLAGDSLGKIAAAHGVKINDIKAANGLGGDLIRIGQKLNIPGASSSGSVASKKTASSKKASAKTSTGGSPMTTMTPRVDKAPEVVVDDIAAVADVADNTPVKDVSPVDVDEAYDYQVQPKDSLEEIARSFIVTEKDILRLNGLSSADEIKPGMTLKIPQLKY